MEPWDTIIKQLEHFVSRIWDVIMEEVKKNENELIELATNRIYNESTDIKGERLRHKYTFSPIYSETYTIVKQKAGLYRGKVDLSFSGEYLDSYEVEINGTKVTIKTNQQNEELSSYIENAYGEVEGLTDEQWEQFAKNILVKKLMSELLTSW